MIMILFYISTDWRLELSVFFVFFLSKLISAFYKPLSSEISIENIVVGQIREFRWCEKG